MIDMDQPPPGVEVLANGLFKAPHGGVFTRRELIQFERAYDMTGSILNGEIVPDRTFFILKRLGVVLHPWPDVIHPLLKVVLEVSASKQAEAPLFRIAAPLDRTLEMERRLERIEAALELEAVSLRPRGSLNVFVDAGYRLTVRFDGPGDAYRMLCDDTETRALILAGWEKRPVKT